MIVVYFDVWGIQDGIRKEMIVIISIKLMENTLSAWSNQNQTRTSHISKMIKNINQKKSETHIEIIQILYQDQRSF